MKEEKLSTKDIVLSVIGILFLSTLIIFPPVFRIVFKEKEKEVAPEKGPIEVTTCIKNGISGTGYTDNSEYIITYQDGEVLNYKKNTERKYSDAIEYQEKKIQYGKLVTALTIIDGYVFSATPIDDTSIIKIAETYKMASFKDTMVTVPGEKEPTEIKNEFYTNSINDVKTALVSRGYNCK